MWIARETNRGRPRGRRPGRRRWCWRRRWCRAAWPPGARSPRSPRGPRGGCGPRRRRGGGLRRRGGRGAGRGDHDLPGHPPGGVGRQVADEVVGAGGGEGEGGLVGAPGVDVRDAQVEGLDDEVVAPGAGVAEGEAGRPGGGGQLVRGEEELGPPLPHLDHGRLGRPLRGGRLRPEEGGAQDAQGEGAAGQDGQPEGGGTKADSLQLDLLGGTLRTGTHRYAPVRTGTRRRARLRPAARGPRDGVPPGIRVPPDGEMCPGRNRADSAGRGGAAGV